MLEASNKMGPMDDAPNIDPMPPSNKKSPDPIPLTPLIILCRRLTANNKPYPKISPNTASRGIVNSSNPIFKPSPQTTRIMLNGCDSKSESKSISAWTYKIKANRKMTQANTLFAPSEPTKKRSMAAIVISLMR